MECWEWPPFISSSLGSLTFQLPYCRGATGPNTSFSNRVRTRRPITDSILPSWMRHSVKNSFHHGHCRSDQRPPYQVYNGRSTLQKELSEVLPYSVWILFYIASQMEEYLRNISNGMFSLAVPWLVQCPIYFRSRIFMYPEHHQATKQEMQTDADANLQDADPVESTSTCDPPHRSARGNWFLRSSTFCNRPSLEHPLHLKHPLLIK
jgi:hypothetical protein